MAQVAISLAAFIFAAALFNSLEIGAIPTTRVSASAPTPVLVPGPESGFSPALSPGPDCSTILFSLADCLSYVQTGSNQTKPEKPCCPELVNLVTNSSVCLCKLLGDPKSTGFDIDVNRALKLPSACDVSTPPVSLCSVLGVPVFAPISSEGSIAPDTGVPALAPTASESPPATGGNPPSSAGTASSEPGNRASRSVSSVGVLGAVILVSVVL
ncbi:hypothetical protein SAY87_013006 [Trapa incisa]|uniref:Bifunctional inhibitor/plant lipid transfer protein/seed storage helical domain-containing protein n=1 Tax=Trapa incisa TaxID=236973 RepID=A0AAN7KFP1_9MYRT|nr:hypothetical protein SAY87_013006 [Trapa incisa]